MVPDNVACITANIFPEALHASGVLSSPNREILLAIS